MTTVAVHQVNALLSVSGFQQDTGRIRSVLDQMLTILQGGSR